MDRLTIADRLIAMRKAPISKVGASVDVIWLDQPCDRNDYNRQGISL